MQIHCYSNPLFFLKNKKNSVQVTLLLNQVYYSAIYLKVYYSVNSQRMECSYNLGKSGATDWKFNRLTFSNLFFLKLSSHCTHLQYLPQFYSNVFDKYFHYSHSYRSVVTSALIVTQIQLYI